MTEPSIDTIAPISRRAVAYLIDALIAAGIAIIGAVILYVVLGGVLQASESLMAYLMATLIGWGVLLLVLLAWMLVYTVMQTKSGSIGMRAQGVRLASAADGTQVGFGRALLRNVVFGVSGWIVVGYFTPLFDSSGRFQGWHDRVAKTVMLDARKSPAPAAAPRAARTAAPATTAVPLPPGAPGIPGIPAPGAGQDGFAAPAGAFAFGGSPAATGGPAAPATPAVPPAAPAHGVPPVPIMPPGPVPPPALGQPPAPAAHTYQPPAFPAPPVPGSPAPAPAPGAYEAPGAYVPPAAPQAASTPAFSPTDSAAAAFTPPTPPAAAGDPSLIAYVPGVTQPGPVVRQDPEDEDLDPELYETVIQGRTPAQSEPTPAPALWTEAGAPAAPQPVMPASAPAAPAVPAPAPAAVPSAAPVAPTAPTPAISEPPASASAPVDPHEAEIEATRISIPGHGLVFTWDDGVRMTVSRRTIFGRNPAPEPGAALVTVRDETLSLSKTHFEAAAEVSGGWVLDRHSTNGMTIVRDGQRIACPPGQRVPVRLGDAIEIGDRIVVIGGYA
jgi:uncharacterized RDD family membrane protein YckC